MAPTTEMTATTDITMGRATGITTIGVASRGVYSTNLLHDSTWIMSTAETLAVSTVSSTEVWLDHGLTARWPFLFFIIMMALSLLGNIFVVVAVCAHDKLRTTFYYLLASLAICDLLNTLFVMPFSLTRTILGE